MKNYQARLECLQSYVTSSSYDALIQSFKTLSYFKSCPDEIAVKLFNFAHQAVRYQLSLPSNALNPSANESVASSTNVEIVAGPIHFAKPNRD